MILPELFYTREDVVLIARELLGKVIVTNIDGLYTAGMIVETEAYAGITDKASHAFNGKRTARTEYMYNGGGNAYVYLCYGIHHLFNVVTGIEGIPNAVLIRGLEPINGVDVMIDRRDMDKLKPKLSAGPGTLSQALGITIEYSGQSLLDNTIYIEDKGFNFRDNDIAVGSRVGVTYAKEDALLPYRFSINGNSYVSKAKGA